MLKQYLKDNILITDGAMGTYYSNNPEYFADVMEDIKKLGVKIIGGCCGTTPAHISKIAQKLGHKGGKIVKNPAILNSAKILKNNNVDLITISDCPLGRTRINSIL